jgi:phosphate starvation-inducible PhoH-like protein
VTIKLSFEDQVPLQLVLGSVGGQAMEELQRSTGVTLHVRGGEVTIDGEDSAAALVERLLRQMVGMARGGTPIHAGDLARALEVMRREPRIDLRTLFDDAVVGKTGSGRPIAPRSLAQKYYVDCLRRYDLNFGVGPAGTGKTYLAVAMGVRMLMDKRVRRILLTRPAIEAGENLGFLPGTFEEKISPYMRPLYDALHDMLDVQKVLRMMEQGIIEIAPLAYMRGRTLSETFLILDEAQNTTPEQMKMFLTRIGQGTRAVVTGDPTQNDLPGGRRSGLSHALKVLRGVEGIGICPFTAADVMRHQLVQRIIIAYDRDDQRRRAAPTGNGPRRPELLPEVVPSSDDAPDREPDDVIAAVDEPGADPVSDVLVPKIEVAGR